MPAIYPKEVCPTNERKPFLVVTNETKYISLYFWHLALAAGLNDAHRQDNRLKTNRLLLALKRTEYKDLCQEIVEMRRIYILIF